MNPNQAEKDLNEIAKDKELIDSYMTYWESITPKNNLNVFRRYIFSFLSVHTPWSANVRSFLLLDKEKNIEAFKNEEHINDLIKESRAGNHKIKAKGISKFATDFDNDPDSFKLAPNENSQKKRDLIMAKCFGLGPAKAAFALEMCFPLTAQTVCLDTHLLQLYGFDDKVLRARAGRSTRAYNEMENHWLEYCRSLDIPPAIARAIWWDKKQQQTSSKYWTYVIEDK